MYPSGLEITTLFLCYVHEVVVTENVITKLDVGINYSSNVTSQKYNKSVLSSSNVVKTELKFKTF